MAALDKLKNRLQGARGRAKEAAGKATGDSGMEREGRTDQIVGSVKEAGEKLKDAAEAARGTLKGEADKGEAEPEN